jgi:hypothetical protein
MSILKAITIAAAARTIERLQLHGKRGKMHGIFEGCPHVLRKITFQEKIHVSAGVRYALNASLGCWSNGICLMPDFNKCQIKK